MNYLTNKTEFLCTFLLKLLNSFILKYIHLFQHEIILTKQLQHSNIIPYLTSFVSDLHVCIVSPLMAYGSCRDLLNLHFHEGNRVYRLNFLLELILLLQDYQKVH